ncbi:MAG: hypothetical protein WCK35_30485 [Chloroflexota bacterium]
MHPDLTSQFSPAALIYIGMGAMIAKILVENPVQHKKTWLEWLQFLVKAGSIVLLWPLVLFIEKFELWLKSSEQEIK